MRAPVLLLHYVQRCQFGQYYLHQSAALQQFQSYARVLGQYYLVQLVLYSFAAHYLYAVGHALQRQIRLVLYLEVKLCGKPHAAHHAQRVVAECYSRLQRRGYYAILQVGQSVEWVYQLAESGLVQTDGHSVDSKVAAVLIVLQRTVFYYRLARVVAIAFLSCTHKLHLVLCALLAELHLRRTKVLKYAQMRLTAHHTLQFLGHTYSAAHHYHVYIVRGSLQEYIPYVPSNHIALQAQMVCSFAYLVEYFLI